MSSSLAKKGRLLAFRVCFFQSLVAVVMTIVVMLIFDRHAGISALMGGMISVIPNSVFALLAFRYSGASQNEQVVRSFSQGSKLKLALTVILGVMAFKWLQLSPLPLFGTFIMATVAQWVALATFKEF